MNAEAMTREGAFQELLGLAHHSYMSYVLTSSSPVVVDDGDRKMLALFEELLEKERYYVERAYELLQKSGLGAMPPTYAIKSSNFNFLRPMKLAEHAAERIGAEIQSLGGLKGRVSGDPGAQEFDRLVDDFVALRREEARRIAELHAASLPPPPPPPAPAAAPAKPTAPAPASAGPAGPVSPTPPAAPKA